MSSPDYFSYPDDSPRTKETPWRPAPSLPGYEQRYNANGNLETRPIEIGQLGARLKELGLNPALAERLMDLTETFHSAQEWVIHKSNIDLEEMLREDVGAGNVVLCHRKMMD